ncbi:MAG TPA: hypothetical protein VL133_00610 [Devosia sp.]|nr:hypothetical protein [Devosia sp.]
MRKLLAAIVVAGATVMGGQVLAADFPEYPPIIDVPDVDYGVQGSFYLRGSASANMLWSRDAYSYDCAPGCGGVVLYNLPFDKAGYGYSFGAGAGYETGTGLRVDGTIDYVGNTGLNVHKGPEFGGTEGDYTVTLRSTIALANVYYDFSFGGGGYGYSAAGGMFAYVGGGAGAAFNQIDVSVPGGAPITGGNTSFAVAGMVGVGYDFGSVVADVGYRGVYIAELSNGLASPLTEVAYNNWLHEVRGTVRYRFN